MLDLDNSMQPHWMTDANVLRKHLRDTLGTDLTVPSTSNPFYYTRKPNNMHSTGNMNYKKPWTRIWRVAYGLCSGEGWGLDGLEKWDDWLRRFLRDHMFPY